MTSFSYLTPAAPSEGLFKEKGSKFISFAFPVTAEKDVKERLAAIKKEYFDAKHHCYAYSLIHPEKKHRAFDAGEPKHSAGDPILGKIRSRNIENVLVVVRYFGGVKLGLGGLVQAYKAAAESALTNATIIEKEMTQTIQIDFDYNDSPLVMRLVKEFGLKILEQDFTSRGQMKVEIKLRSKDKFLEKFESFSSLQMKLLP